MQHPSRPAVPSGRSPSRLLHPPIVLAYHAVGEVAAEHDPDNLVHPIAKFRSELEGLLRRGYEFVIASELGRRLRQGVPLRSTCVLTLDDGSLDNLTVLPGLLEELNVPATVFACPGLLGRPHPWLAPEAGIRLMDIDELRTLSSHELVEIGSHTNEHTDLEHAGAEDAYRELSSSKAALEEMLGKEVETFAYPYCRYSPACPGAAERAGYLCAFTCGARGGWAPYEIRRQMMDRFDSRIVWALKSRSLFYEVAEAAPVRLLRRGRRALR
jgi:peptidoglycan/xylan/chitin deacetylase (PgdA/CDA1 family)